MSDKNINEDTLVFNNRLKDYIFRAMTKVANIGVLMHQQMRLVLMEIMKMTS